MGLTVAVDALSPVVGLVRAEAIVIGNSRGVRTLRGFVRAVHPAGIARVAPMLQPAVHVSHTNAVITTEQFGFSGTACPTNNVAEHTARVAEIDVVHTRTAAHAGVLHHRVLVFPANTVLALLLITTGHALAAVDADGRIRCAQTVKAGGTVNVRSKAVFLYAHSTDTALARAVIAAAVFAKVTEGAELYVTAANVLSAIGTGEVRFKVGIFHAHFAGASLGFAVGQTALGAKLAIFAQLCTLLTEVKATVGAVGVILEIRVLHAHAASTAGGLAVIQTALGAQAAQLTQLVSRFAQVVVAVRAGQMIPELAVLHAHAAYTALVLTGLQTAQVTVAAQVAGYVAVLAVVVILAVSAPEVLHKVAFLYTHTANAALCLTVCKAAALAKAAAFHLFRFKALKAEAALVTDVVHAVYAVATRATFFAPVGHIGCVFTALTAVQLLVLGTAIQAEFLEFTEVDMGEAFCTVNAMLPGVLTALQAHGTVLAELVGVLPEAFPAACTQIFKTTAAIGIVSANTPVA